jgi:hypothetical protein
MVMVMMDASDAELKAEIDKIVKKVDKTMRKIESVVPFNSESEKDDREESPDR